MKKDEIIEMAREAGFLYGVMGPSETRFVTAIGHTFTVELEAFAKLVEEKATEKANARANASWTLMCEKMVAFERGACAKVCDEHSDDPVYCGDAIRARGQA
jgi:hypothetical protein